MRAKPEIAWLLSFPNSGTSFTTALVRVLTETSTATNYDEAKHPVPVFSEYQSGPFTLRKHLPLPDKGYVLTKTHCTRCRGKQKSVIKTTDEFIQGCQTVKMDDSCAKYDPKIVKRAVHLFRNPFDNVVGRFHLEWKNKNKRGDSRYVQKYSYSKEGFRKWCHDYKHHQDHIKDKEFIKSLDDSGIICPIEFYLYVQFHNNALDAVKELDIPVHVVDYADYHTNYNRTVAELLNFLELEQVPGTEKSFFMSSHEDFYTPEERRNTAEFLLKYSSPEAWNHLYDKYLHRLI